MKAALLQLTSSDDPANNLSVVSELIDGAAAKGATFILTPEVTNCVSLDRDHQDRVLKAQSEDASLAALRVQARALGVWLAIGSLALKGGDGGRFVNRSFVIAPNGEIVATYDKLHMFDVNVDATETFRESEGYAPGDRAVVVKTDFATLGLTVCYDVRFAYLHRALAKAGAEILLVPAAFSPVTGAAHWETLLRARAIETGCYVLAAAQTGTHPNHAGPVRNTHGHSMAVAPWGEVILDAGTEPGAYYIDLDLTQVEKARNRVPSLFHDRGFTLET